jgi:hypothetical protein
LFILAAYVSAVSVVTVFIKQPERIHRINAVILIGMVAAIGGWAIWMFWSPSNLAPAAVTTAATLATIGWIAQRDAALFVSRKQHTMNILVQMRHSELFNRHRFNVFYHYPGQIDIPPADVAGLFAARDIQANYGVDHTGKDKYPVIESIIFLANFYEFLAAAIDEGDLDEALLRKSIRGVAIRYYQKVRPVLEHVQLPGPNGVPTNKYLQALLGISQTLGGLRFEGYRHSTLYNWCSQG